MGLVRILLHALARLVLTVVFGASLGEPIREDPCAVVANHDTHLDVFALFGLFPLSRVPRVHAVAAEDYFKKGPLGAAARILFGAILIKRGSGKGEAVLDPIRRALERGDSIVVFPEGTRGEPGVLMTFKSGIGAIALEYPDLPIVPVALKGIERTLPKGGSVPVPFCFKAQRLPTVTGRGLASEPGADRKTIAAELERRIRAELNTE
jgi:1-acyl-sn-glycerol-3-phosphate acyltransferase